MVNVKSCFLQINTKANVIILLAMLYNIVLTFCSYPLFCFKNH